MREVTLEQLRKILTDNNIEYYVASSIDGVVKINFLVKKERQQDD